MSILKSDPKFLFIFVLAIIVSCSKKTTITTDTIRDEHKILEDTILVIPVKNSKSEIKYAFEFDKSPLLSDLFEKASIEKKLVYVDINAKWCAPCKLMQRDVYTHDQTATFFNEHFLNYMVDIDTAEGPDIKLIYDIHVIPTLLWLDSKGRVVHKKEGACYHKELIENAQIALEKP